MLADRSPITIAVIGIAVTAVLVVVAVGVGNVWVSPTDTLAVLADHLLPGHIDTSPVADPIVWNIRMPRVMTAAAVGAALGLAGVGIQGLHRNPVADPYLVGLSSIAMVGVLVGALVGWESAGPVAGVIGGAFVGSVGSWVVARVAAGTSGDPSRFILAGIGLGSAIAGLVAGTAVAINDPRVPDLPFWFVGSLAGATWGTALWVLIAAAVGLAATVPLGPGLDMMSLGAAAAGHLGVDVRRLGVVVMASLGLAAGGAVGAAGAVGFVGLAAGHGARYLAGEHHRRTLIAGFFVGAIAVVLADALGRVIGGRFEIPIGLVTAVIGGPFLVWLIVSGRTAE